MSKLKKRVSLQYRILVIISLLLVCVLGFVFIIFNVLFNQFSEQTVRKQLKAVVELAPFGSETPYMEPPPPPSQQTPPPPQTPGYNGNSLEKRLFPDMRKIPRSPFGKSDDIVITDTYEIIFPTEDIAFWKNLEETKAIVQKLKSDEIILTNSDIMKLKLDGKEFYFVSMPVDIPDQTSEAFFIHYIDMTSITSFSERINQVLIIAFLLACILAIISAMFLSKIVTKPIQEITKFAEEIGKGNFIQKKNDYNEKETFKLAESMNKTSSELKKLTQEEQFFFQNVSHDLRTPLQIIQCNIEGFENNIIDRKSAVNNIKAETFRLSDMVNDLLYYSYIDNTKDKMKLQKVDIRELLSVCLEQQNIMLKSKNIIATCEFSESEVLLLCDEKRIIKAFSNLINNAIRYADKKIILSCYYFENNVVVKIENDGEKIQEQYIPKIFDRFFKGKRGNYGIGLSIVKSIVLQHKGKITAEATKQGICFSMHFPTAS